jgi:Dyp-type peroxidase family
MELNLCDLQGFVARGYSGRSFPVASFLLARIHDAASGREFLGRILTEITTGQLWNGKKPASTLNVGFTHAGLAQLGLPEPTLQSFPVEFVQGMKSRGKILGDTGADGPANWESIWQQDGHVHIWLGIYGVSKAALEERCRKILAAMSETRGATVLRTQEAGALVIGGEVSTKEHFGYSDGFGNPDIQGLCRKPTPGQGKLTDGGKWVPLATGEYLIGYPDEACELPVSPIPYLLASNGTYMVYRKLHENVATFRKFLKERGGQYGGGEKKLAAKLVGRWLDGTPLELSPDKENSDIVNDDTQNTNFAYGKDSDGTRCPLGSHIRRTNPRDAFGFSGQLVNRRRIMRRGLPYGTYVPDDQPVRDDGEHGIIFMALCASLFRQFEFIQQQWVQHGNDAHLGNDKDPLLGNQRDQDRFVIPGDTTPKNPPFVCPHLPDFVNLLGGEYFFLPSITALRMIAEGGVDPR